MGQGRQAYARAQIGVQAEMLSQRQQGAALRLFIGGKVLPLGAAYGAEQDGVRLFTGSDGLFRKGLAAMVDARAAHKSLLAAHGKSKLGTYGVQNLQGLRHDLGPDAVAGQNSNMMVMFTHVAESLGILPSKVKKHRWHAHAAEAFLRQKAYRNKKVLAKRLCLQ